MAGLPYEVEVATRCRFTPETCMDDMCRGSVERGLCGNWRADVVTGAPEDDDEVYSYEWPEDED